MLQVENISVSYGNIQVIWNISFEVREGEIVTIIGPNKAGKTTTVKTVMGLLHPFSGRIVFQGNRIEKLAPYSIVERGVVLIPEGRELFPQMNVMENLLLGAYTRRAEKEKAKTLEHVFELFPQLEPKKKQLAWTLSGGEQQMLAIARGLMSAPSLLILDEPSLGLAPILVEKMLRTIYEINREGITILLVEQNVHSALEIAKRGYVFEAGKIVLAGEGEELLRNPHVKKVYLGM